MNTRAIRASGSTVEMKVAIDADPRDLRSSIFYFSVQAQQRQLEVEHVGRYDPAKETF
jgi:hypothetical protein